MHQVVLTFDTASPANSVALSAEGQTSVASSTERGWAEGLLQHTQQLLAERQLSLRDVSAIGVVRGPGSFTGVRIGLAVALGLHQSLGVPAGGFCTHDVLDQFARATRPPMSEWICAVDAHRGRHFVRRSVFNLPRTAHQLQALEPDSYEVELWPNERLFGSALPTFTAGPAAPTSPGVQRPLAAVLADLFDLHGFGDRHPLDESTLSAPLYLQRPQLVTAEQAAMARRARQSG